MNNISKDDLYDFLSAEKLEWYKNERRKAFSDFEKSKLETFRHGLNIVIMPSIFKFEDIKPELQSSATVSLDIDKRIASYSGTHIPASIGSSDYKIDTKIFSESINPKMLEEKSYNFTRAFSNNIILLAIPDDYISDKPLYITKEITGGVSVGRVLIIAGKNSKATIIISKNGTGNAFITEDVFVECKTNSRIDIVTISDYSPDCVVVQYNSGKVMNDAEIRWIDLSLGADYNRSSFINNLDKEGAKGYITALFLGTGKQNYDLYTASHHNAPNTNSDILTRGAVNNSAKALSRGLVRIEDNASNSNGYEKQEALILSQTAEADAIPNLEIHNGEVKCSHGSTIGQVDAEVLFYAMSRGLNKEEAIKKIIEGYFDVVVRRLPQKAAAEIEKAIIKELAA